MSTTIGDLVDRVYREYLEPMDNIVSYTILGSGIDDTATEITFNGDLLSVEEEDALDAGAIIEIGQELMICTDLNAVTNTVTVTRGARGTTASPHLINSIIKITPPFARINVFNAVKDQIENLYPTLFAVEVQTLTSATGWVALEGADDNRIIAPLKAISQFTTLSDGDETSVQFRGVSVELIDVPTSVTSTGKAVQFNGIQTGVPVHVTFKKKFGTVTNEDTTLSDVGLETEYEPIIMAGVAAQMVAGKDIPTVTAEYITDQISVGNYPIGSSNSLRNSLLQYQQLLITQARKDLRARYPEPVQLNSVVYPSA
jgi:hypothetical protein